MKDKIRKIILFLFLALFTLAIIGIYVPKSSRFSTPIVFEIEKGEGVFNVSQKLKEKGVILNRASFLLYALKQRAFGDLKAGRYEVSDSMAVFELVDKFVGGDVIKKVVTIPEGWSLLEVNEMLISSGITGLYETTGYPASKIPQKDCPKDLNLLQSEDFSEDYPFLEDKPKDVSLEGYLFPDTYELEEGASSEDFVEKALANFQKKLSPELIEEINLQKKTVFEIVTMASILEKEVKTFRDKKLVSGILWKRIGAGMPLQADATILYSLGPGSAVDTSICSPYNTYKFTGLPLGPISNPGKESLLAAIYPEKSSYWYYLSDSSGTTHFSATYDEHLKNKAEYLK